MEYPSVHDNSVRAEAIAWWLDLEDQEREHYYRKSNPARPYNPNPSQSWIEGAYCREYDINE